MKELFQLLKQHNLSPNGFYLIYCLQNQCDLDLPVNHGTEITKLKFGGFLTEDLKLTDSSKSILNDVEIHNLKTVHKVKEELKDNFSENIEIYRKKFPLGSGKRTSLKELEPKFTWFFKMNPQFTWEIVLNATDRYIESCKDLTYCRTAGYFIKKGVGPNVISDLATWCESYIEESNEPAKAQEFDKLI
jgi:hypothetical protein